MKKLMASIVLRCSMSEWSAAHSYFSPQNFAVQTFVEAPPYGLRRGAGINFITQTHVKSYILRNQSVAFFLCFHIVKIPPCYTSGMEEFL